MESLISIENNFEPEEMENETCRNTTLRKTVVKINELLIEIKNMTNVFKATKPVDVNMQQYSSLGESSRTTKLWLQYLYYIDVVRLFIRTERIGDWDLYLISLKKAINLFAATGHINYAKCECLN